MMQLQHQELEFDLLTYCCGLARKIPTRKDHAKPKARMGIDETRFIELAKMHKVAATAYAGLREAGTMLSPAGMRGLAREAMVGQASHSLLLEDRRELIKALKARKIMALSIKAPAPSIPLYGGAKAFEFNDLDILADISSIQDIAPLMSSLGYECSNPASAKRAAWLPSSSLPPPPHASYQKPERLFHVDIYGKTWLKEFAFSPDYMEGLSARAVSPAEGQDWETALCPSDNALFIIALATQQSWSLLHWLLDLAAMLHGKDPCLHQAIAEQVAARSLEPQLEMACAVVQSLYPIEIPAMLRDIIAGERPTRAMSLGYALKRLRNRDRQDNVVHNTLVRSSVFIPSLFKARR